LPTRRGGLCLSCFAELPSPGKEFGAEGEGLGVRSAGVVEGEVDQKELEVKQNYDNI